jgi:hypothetical protein
MKQILFNIAVFFKKPNVINRLILLGGSLLILTLSAIPDLKFNLQMKNPKKLTIEEIQKTPKDLLPRYIVLDKAQLMKVKSTIPQSEIDSMFGGKVKISSDMISLQQQSYNYVLEQRLNKKGDTTISSISYPIYSTNEIQKNPNASTADLICNVVIQDSRITKKMLEGDKYFTDSTFAINGSFNGSSISQENLKLLQESGYNVSKDAIVLQKGDTPKSLTASIILTSIASFIGLFCFLAFLPMSLLCKIFGVEQEVIRID